MIKLKSITILSAVLLITGCSMPQQRAFKVDVPEFSFVNINQDDNMFQPDENSQNKYVFNTNNKEFLKKNGYTIWCEKYTNSSKDFEPVNVELKKNSGNSDMGFGIIFCSKTVSSKENYLLAVLINKRQQYNVGKVVNGVYTSLSNGWKKSTNLYTGDNENKISVDYITSGDHSKKFQLKLNDKITEYFSDTDNVNPVFNGTKSGYVVSISSNEDFDRSSVNVEFIK